MPGGPAADPKKPVAVFTVSDRSLYCDIRWPVAEQQESTGSAPYRSTERRFGPGCNCKAQSG